MKHADLYSGFAPEKQEAYEHWLVERYGDEMRAQIETSRAKYASLSSAEKEQAGRELAEIESDLAESCRRAVPADSPALGPALERHRAWVAYMWGRPCSPEAYSGLADLYLSHPDFRARYETLAAGFCDYLAQAMQAHATRVTAEGTS